jgi:hypothetical protein
MHRHSLRKNVLNKNSSNNIFYCMVSPTQTRTIITGSWQKPLSGANSWTMHNNAIDADNKVTRTAHNQTLYCYANIIIIKQRCIDPFVFRQKLKDWRKTQNGKARRRWLVNERKPPLSSYTPPGEKKIPYNPDKWCAT